MDACERGMRAWHASVACERGMRASSRWMHASVACACGRRTGTHMSTTASCSGVCLSALLGLMAFAVLSRRPKRSRMLAWVCALSVAT